MATNPASQYWDDIEPAMNDYQREKVDSKQSFSSSVNLLLSMLFRLLSFQTKVRFLSITRLLFIPRISLNFPCFLLSSLFTPASSSGRGGS